MRTLVLGGIRSGKSDWAEQRINESPGAVRYLATGPATEGDPSWARRVAAHRARRPAHWATIETTDVAATLRADPATAALVDDIGGWLTAVMDGCDAWNGGSIERHVAELVDAVAEFDAPLVLVSPEVGLTVVPAVLLLLAGVVPRRLLLVIVTSTSPAFFGLTPATKQFLPLA